MRKGRDGRGDYDNYLVRLATRRLPASSLVIDMSTHAAQKAFMRGYEDHPDFEEMIHKAARFSLQEKEFLVVSRGLVPFDCLEVLDEQGWVTGDPMPPPLASSLQSTTTTIPGARPKVSSRACSLPRDAATAQRMSMPPKPSRPPPRPESSAASSADDAVGAQPSSTGGVQPSPGRPIHPATMFAFLQTEKARQLKQIEEAKKRRETTHTREEVIGTQAWLPYLTASISK